MVSETPFVPPGLRAAVERLDEEFLPNAPSWFRSRGLAVDLDGWINLGRDAASFWGFADDYVNELGCRERLVVWMDRSDGIVRQWLVGEVDRADEFFRSNSAPRSVDGLPEQLLEPSAWWRRRLPSDQTLATALLAISG